MMLYIAKKYNPEGDDLLDDDEDSSEDESEEECIEFKELESDRTDMRQHLIKMTMGLSRKIAGLFGQNMRTFGLSMSVALYRQYFAGVSQRRPGPMRDVQQAMKSRDQDFNQEVVMREASHSRQIAEK